jgi:hypothetical protein
MYATLEKTVTVEITPDIIEQLNEHGEASIDVDVDVDLWEFDNEDIRAEYDERFGDRLEEHDWRRLYEKRCALPVEEFLKIVDNLIMDQTGRIL